MAEAEQHDTDRSEDPTQKRLDEALERGDVVKSQEVSTWFVIAGGALVLAAFGGSMGGALSVTFRGLLSNAHQIRSTVPACWWCSAGSSGRCWLRSRFRSPS
jgi:flagellar biosynthesis protein FlhB